VPVPADMNVQSWHVDVDLRRGGRHAADRHCAGKAHHQGRFGKMHRMDFLFPIRGPIIIAAPGHFFRNSTFSNISTICRAITTGAGRHPLAPRLCCALSHDSDNLCSIGCTDAAKLHLPDTRASARAIFSLVVGSLALARMLGPLFAGAAHTLKAPLAQLTNIEPAEEPVDVGLVMDSDGRGRRQNHRRPALR
jgi:hypothetical protein